MYVTLDRPQTLLTSYLFKDITNLDIHTAALYPELFKTTRQINKLFFEKEILLFAWIKQIRIDYNLRISINTIPFLHKVRQW